MKLNFVYKLSILLFFSYVFSSNSGGRNGLWAGAPGDSGNCSTCHTTAGSGSVELTGVPTNYTSGTTYSMTLTINDAGAAVGGFQIVATDGASSGQVGTFTPQGAQRLTANSRLVQNGSAAFSGGSVSWPISWTAPPTGTDPVQFFFSGNAANGNGSNGGGDMGYANASTAVTFLPVELTFFEGKIVEKQIQLSWQTATEINSDYFEVERSVGTTNKFEPIGRLEAAGNANNRRDYEFWDENPTANQLLYYRLKQVDFDGTVTFSKVQTIKMKATNISVYPNILKKETPITVMVEDQPEELFQVQLMNMLGQIVYADKIELQAGANTIDLPNLTDGTFMLAISNQNELLVTKRIVIHN